MLCPARSPKALAFSRLTILITMVVAGLAWTPPARSAGADALVPPGGVVRWSAAGTTACGFGSGASSERWEPVGETCWYPIDLLHEPGSVQVIRWRNGTREIAHVHVGDYPYEVQHIELKDESKVHLSDEDLARARRESREVGALWSRRGPRLFDLPLGTPLDPLPEGGRFGSRRFFNGEPRSPHTGADYGAPAGAPVRAAGNGVVALADHHFFSGKSVFLDHGDGLVTMYFHLREIAVKEGERVERGQVLGEVGSTGRATGPHLHFGIRWRGKRVDPEMLLDPSASPAVP
jgi:hypothetical protein